MFTSMICVISSQHASAIVKKSVVPFPGVISSYGFRCDFHDLSVMHVRHILEKEMEVDSTDVSVKEGFGTAKSEACNR